MLSYLTRVLLEDLWLVMTMILRGSLWKSEALSSTAFKLIYV